MRSSAPLLVLLILAAACAGPISAKGPIRISGRYPHLAMFNHGQECGIGAVVPWAGKLWAITYPPHAPRGSDDKLYEIDEQLNVTARGESVGGTPANRLIHRESRQLFLGPYCIDAKGNVRVIPYAKAPGRPTATARHLTDPAGKVYTFTMEEGLYEIDVKTLAVTVLHKDSCVKGFVDYLPGYHGKGGYSGQGRLVVANNGRKPQKGQTDRTLSGCLAEWDGKAWKVVEEHQFNEVSGPGGVEGNAKDTDPIWATGWDRKSLLLKLRDGGRWYTYRLPISDYSYMASHGWYTEWPRIREVAPAEGKLLMNMHGGWFDFPKTFCAANSGGLRPIASHLKITGDFAPWRGEIVFGCDDTAITGGNRFVNQSHSNLWFTSWANLARCGRPSGWGGPWVQDDVKAGAASPPYLFAGYRQRMVHLSHQSDSPVTFTFEADPTGKGDWAACGTVTVGAKGYAWHVFAADAPGQWIRVKTDKDCAAATAYFHYGPGGGAEARGDLPAALAACDGSQAHSAGIIRPRGGDLGTLQFLAQAVGADGQVTATGYYEIDKDMKLARKTGEAAETSQAFLAKTAPVTSPDFIVGAASVVVTEGGKRFHLPKGPAAYGEKWPSGWPRGIREVVTERRLFNAAGTFYVLPHGSAGGVAGIKPVCTHDRRISDFCSWRGMIVLAGGRLDAKADGHYVPAPDGRAGLWFGDVDDLWKFGKPRGVGGPWKNSLVKKGAASDPYLMTGYDKKTLALSHDAAGEVTFTVEVDVTRGGPWRVYKALEVPAGKTVEHAFGAGYSAHWVRLKASDDCNATAIFTYE